MQLLLAGKTAVLRVGGVGRIVELSGRHLLVANAEPAGLLDRLAAQVRRQRRRHPGDRHRSIPQMLHGKRRHQSAVDTARVGHQHGGLGRQYCTHTFESPFQGRRQALEQTKHGGSANAGPVTILARHRWQRLPIASA